MNGEIADLSASRYDGAILIVRPGGRAMDSTNQRIVHIEDMVTQLVRHVGAWHAESRQQIAELRVEIGGVRDDLRGKICEVRDELKGEITGVRNELRDEIAEVRHELKGEVFGVRDELKGEICGARDEVKAEIFGLRDELNGEIGGVKGEIGELRGETRGVSTRLEGRMGALEDAFSQLSEDVRVSWAESVRQWADLGKRVQRVELKFSNDT